ncbi:inner centromere protein-like [Pristis pectinata]|uniref:inner centromere protein-like n=1 Tax=Pristis pectinata TaxID=685728 RepID=UPI00223E3FAB|nr:inner centromere protein-like [Pristis pectinata]
MASGTAITMVDTNNVLKFFGEKLNAIIERFKENEIWLKEIQEEAKVMFVSGFNAEPELMPKTPSERKRRRRCPSMVQDPNKRFSRSRKSLRRSSVQRIKLRNRVFEEDNKCTEMVEQAQPACLTQSASYAAATTSQETEKTSASPALPINGRVPLVDLSLNDCKSAELYQKAHMAYAAQTLQNFESVNLPPKAGETKLLPQNGTVLESWTPSVTVLHLDSPNHETNGLKINADATKSTVSESSSGYWELSNAPADEVCISEEDLNKSVCRTKRRTRRLMRKSIAGRRSSSARLTDKYSLNVQRTTMVQESTRKSLRKSIARRKSVLLSSVSSYNDSIEKTKENVKNECVEAISRTVLQPEQPEEKLPAASASEKDCSNLQNTAKVAISNLENMAVAAVKPQVCRTSPRIQRKDSINSGKLNSANQTDGCKSRCEHGVECISSDPRVLNNEDFPLASPPISTTKVGKSKHKNFLHAVQNNQLLKTPVSVGRSMVKSFIKLKTPMKVDAKEKEMICLANLKKKQDQEEERIRKLEEEKKRKLEEFKKKRELRLKRALDARSRVEKQEEKKKNKIEQKLSRTNKNEKLREEKVAEEKAKKLTVKKMEGESRRWQEEDRKQGLLQMEEEQQELQHKEEKELQQQCKLAGAKKLQEQREPELEREQQYDLHWATDKEWERKEQESFLAEKEHGCLAKKGSLQLQQKLEQTTWNEAVLQVQPVKERLSNGVQGKVTVWEEMQTGEPESWCLKNETQRKQLEHDQHGEENKLEDQKIKWMKEQDRKAAEVASNKSILDKTMEGHHPAEPESYTMTPSSYSKVKLPKINLENYGMDLNSDDSTDDEGMPRKPIPAWADGKELQQALRKQYYHPFNLDKLFSVITPPNLETIFGKRKPRYLKRTSSAVWHSPPGSNSFQNLPCGFVKH